MSPSRVRQSPTGLCPQQKGDTAVEKKNPAEGGASRPGLGYAGSGVQRYVTAAGQGGLESGAGTKSID